MDIVLIIWNSLAFLMMGADKRRAGKGERRISERTLFTWAAFFGAAGILAGMYTFRHKTRHMSFVLGVPVLLAVNIAVLYYVWR